MSTEANKAIVVRLYEEVFNKDPLCQELQTGKEEAR